jgi:hypothetical protein
MQMDALLLTISYYFNAPCVANQNYTKEEDNNEMLLEKRRCFLSINKTKRWNERECTNQARSKNSECLAPRDTVP